MAFLEPQAWPEVCVDDLKAPIDNALSTGPFGSSIGSRFFQTTGVPLIRGSNLMADGRTHLIDDDMVFVSEAKASELRRSMVSRGDLIFTCWGTINQVGVISDRAIYPKYIISNKQMKLTPDPKKADSLFLFYLFSGAELQNQIINQSIGSSVPGFNLGQLRALRFCLPPLLQQEAIAEALSDADNLIESLEQLLAKKRDIRTATMQQLLTGEKRLAGFKGKWDLISIEKDAHLKARIGWQALTTKEYLDSGSYYLVTGTDFIEGRVDWSTCHFVDEWRYSQDRNIQLKKGDVLLTKDGTIGKVGYIDHLDLPATLNSGVFVIRPVNNKFDPLYLYYVLSSRIFDDFLSKITAGSTITHLYQKDFVTFEFLAPDVSEQKQIATVLDAMDVELSHLLAKLNKVKSIKQGMMQELLAGRTRLVKEPQSFAEEERVHGT